ncbi:MAG TPA: bifunctional DNA primase/polymerase [Candidatus Cybelea sp.]|nr:bifunctional DNA primase/polymerase [Candidatus Cybelea sp.]
MSSPTIPMALQAIPYINGGLSVFPCAKKKPLTEHGCLDASKDVKQIAEWWKRWPEAQIGIATGPVSNLVVLDVDGPQGFAWLSGRLLPETREVETQPGNKHFWFRLPAGRTAKNSAGDFAPEVDVRGAGGYVIAPPSIHHETLKPYRFLNKVALAEAPPWLLEPPPKPTNGNGHSGEIGLVIHEGDGRHREALRLAGGLRARGADAKAILADLQIFSQQHCRPPLELAWMEKQARYIGTKPAGFRGQSIPSDIPSSATLVIKTLDSVRAKPQQYLWDRYLPNNQLIAVFGASHTGKTPLVIDLAARITAGADWPDGTKNGRGAKKVLFLGAGEDALDTVVKPRLVIARGRPENFKYIETSRRCLFDGTVLDDPAALDRDIDLLAEEIRGDSSISLLVIDPITNHLGQKKLNLEEEIRPILMRLKHLAEQFLMPVITIGHLNRREKGTSALDRMLGARAFSGVARTIFFTGPDNEATEKHHFTFVQERGLGAPAWRFHTELVSATVDDAEVKQIKVVWGGTDETINSQDVVDSLNAGEKSQLEEAAQELIAFVTARGGEAPQAECISHLFKLGYPTSNPSRLRRRANLESVRERDPFGKMVASVWRVPDNPPDGQKERAQ